MKPLLSPEFHRYLWLRFSPLRLIAVPVALFAIGMIAHRTGGVPALHKASSFFFSLCVFVWGNYEAAHALAEEVKDKTWDHQKMSALNAAELAFGKLFGATSFSWYAGLLLLAVATATHQGDSAAFALSMLLGGVFGQALAMLISFADYAAAQGRGARERAPGTKLPFLLGMALSFKVGSAGFMSLISLLNIPNAISNAAGGTIFKWYGTSYNAETFTLAATLVFCGWCLLGLYRQARSELMFRQMPAAWLGFVATVALFAGGFRDLSLSMRTVAMCQTFFVFTYIMMVIEAGDRRVYGRLLRHGQAGRWREALLNTPKWLSTLPLGIFLLGMVFSLRIAQPEGMPPFVFLASMLLFLLRDALVLHALGAGRSTRFHKLFYFGAVYAVIPMLHSVFALPGISFTDALGDIVGGESNIAEKLRFLAFYYPVPMQNIFFGLAPAAVQVALAGWWLKMRVTAPQK